MRLVVYGLLSFFLSFFLSFVEDRGRDVRALCFYYVCIAYMSCLKLRDLLLFVGSRNVLETIGNRINNNHHRMKTKNLHSFIIHQPLSGHIFAHTSHFYQFQEIDQRPAPSMMKYGFSLNGLCGCGCSPISKLTLVSPTLVSFDSSLQAGDVTACGLLFGHMPSLLTPAAFDRICEASLPRKKR